MRIFFLIFTVESQSFIWNKLFVFKELNFDASCMNIENEVVLVFHVVEDPSHIFPFHQDVVGYRLKHHSHCFKFLRCDADGSYEILNSFCFKEEKAVFAVFLVSFLHQYMVDVSPGKLYFVLFSCLRFPTYVLYKGADLFIFNRHRSKHNLTHDIFIDGSDYFQRGSVLIFDQKVSFFWFLKH